MVWLARGRPGDGSYQWPRSAPDGGSVYASRLAPGAVIIDQIGITAPKVLGSIRLPYTVNLGAPAGYCPIDGYLATFRLGAAGLLLLTHRAGPIGHFCPATLPGATTINDPWRCRSPEGTAFELRAPDFTTPGQALGMFIGAKVEGAADNRLNTTVAIDEGAGGVTAMRVDGSPPPCCFGSNTGVAFAVSPDGQQLALSHDGRSVQIAGIESSQAPRNLWTSPDEITALTWTMGWIIAVHANAVSYIATIGPSGANRPRRRTRQGRNHHRPLIHRTEQYPPRAPLRI